MIDYYSEDSWGNVQTVEGRNAGHNQSLHGDFAWSELDPYAAFVDEPNDMLFSLREYWNSQNELVNTNRNLVHLFSKRNNTGTGGIAFLNGLGSNWNGYGLSSNLTDDDDYVNLPVPYFFWNIYCFIHELGHNFGANHTQWCGWEGGPIDNCANLFLVASNVIMLSSKYIVLIILR